MEQRKTPQSIRRKRIDNSEPANNIKPNEAKKMDLKRDMKW
jgi:hypothetical protein